MNFQTLYKSPLGWLLLKANEDALTNIIFDPDLNSETELNSILNKAIIQLDEYFEKKRTEFDLPLETSGTAFQKEVWNHLQTIRYGEQISYSQLAKRFGNVLAIRAIASANGKNPIPVIIPCHRVVGSKGELVGFSGGLWRKQLLLELEGGALF